MAVLTSVIPTSYKVPRAFLKVTLGVGPRSPGAGSVKLLLIGNKTSAGSATVATAYAITSNDDAIARFGRGSELHRMCKAAFAAYGSADITAMAVTEAGTAATKSIATAVGPASVAGTLEVWIAGRRVVVQIAVGDTISTVSTNLAAAINATPDLPVTAAANTPAGTTVLTAKNVGVRGNHIAVRSLLTGGTGLTHVAATGYAAGGATSDDPQACLDAVASSRYHLIVSPYVDATNLAKFKAHCDTQAQPLQGRRQRWIACFNGTLAAGITLADTINAQRGQLVWEEDPDDLPGEIAAGFAAYVASQIGSDRAANLDGLVIPGLQSQYDASDVPTESEQDSALNNGLTPLLSGTGRVSIVRSITSYHLDSGGLDDFSVLDSHYVDVPDFIADDLQANFTTAFAGFKIAPATADGSPPGPRIATPASVKDWIFSRLKFYENQLIVNVDALKDSIIVEIDAIATGRMNAEIPVDVIELFHQMAGNVAQVG
jgi:phage tail sheath gpL-like